jgi:hypothetical protein
VSAAPGRHIKAHPIPGDTIASNKLIRRVVYQTNSKQVKKLKTYRGKHENQRKYERIRDESGTGDDLKEWLPITCLGRHNSVPH